MGWFGFGHAQETKKREADLTLLAPMSGSLVMIEDVPDVIFSEKIVGDGIAIKPTDNKVLAPCDATVVEVFETNHAIVLKSNPLELLIFIHIGIDTVDLKGEDFFRKVQAGDNVHAGDVLLEFNLNMLQSKAKSTITPLLISASHMNRVKNLELLFSSSNCQAGVTPLLGIDIKSGEDA